MPLLSRQAIQAICQALQETYFTLAGYKTSFPEEGKVYFVAEFLDNPAFRFELRRSDQRANPYDVRYSPGEVFANVMGHHSDFDDTVRTLRNWASLVRKEIIAQSPLYSELDELRKNLNARIDRELKDADARFSEDELEKVRAQLDELDARFAGMQEEMKITDRELGTIRDEIRILRQDAAHFSKKSWFRTAGNKLLNLASAVLRSKAGQKILEEGTKRLLDMPD